ncbi:MAG: FAD/FMN-containing dehydrogenase [Candidatus Woesearchaeota archaeon]|jgi:FAD/FMN-containing dehydrogenase
MISRQEYEVKKKKISQELQAKSKYGHIALHKKTSNVFRERTTNKKSRIDVSTFTNVISIDTKNEIAYVEGMTTFEDFVAETLKVGYMPAVVPELKLITIGGAVTGIGIESSSFKEGLLHETITEMEILLADGSVATCTKTNKHKDLFFGFANSYGTLGYALILGVRLVKVKPYVKLTHIKHTNSKKYFSELKDICLNKQVDFVDGTVFSEKEMYITVGTFVSKAPHTSDYTYKQIYYKSIQRKQTDYLTIYNYIWRWDTDWFWCSKLFFAQNPIIRFLFGKKRLHSKTYHAIRKWNLKYKVMDRVRFWAKPNEQVVQDVQIPIDESESFLTHFFKKIPIRPIWICPTKMVHSKEDYVLYPLDQKKLYVNFGFWDSVASPSLKHFNRIVEQEVQEHKGAKSLYSEVYYDKKKFWQLYNKKAYDALKTKYDANKVFLNLYDKCVGRK